MIDRNRAGVRALSRRLSAVALVSVLGACQDLPLHPGAGSALPPDRPSALLNPLCTGTGGTTHGQQTISTAVTWQASGNPHSVTGDVSVSTGGQLTLQPGVVACFSEFAGLQAGDGGRLVAQGLAASRIILTASDLARKWKGVVLAGDPSSASLLKNVTIEQTALGTAGIDAFYHLVVIDSTVIRQTGEGVRLWGRGSRMVRSQVDTTLDRTAPAVFLSDSVYLEQTVVRGAAGVGVETDIVARVHLLGVRIEGPAGTGLRVSVPNSIKSAQPVRVVGGGTYGAELTVDAMARIYPNGADQDSLLGNARDTLLMLGGPLSDDVYARSVLPWHVKGSIQVGAGGLLRGQAGSLFVFDPNTGISAHSGGRVRIRSWRSAPAVLTADYPAAGWDGILLEGTPSSESYLTNVRVEHVRVDSTAVIARSGHPVVIDSAVFRQNGRAVGLWSANSRLSRSRVDTTLAANAPAVILGSNALLESTLVRASSGEGVSIRNGAVQVISCEVRNSVEEGIILGEATPVHNCNLVSNGGAGIRNK
ncbi:MAG TPA: right-handed parallel beta-helix repeat-containing protein, partial [Longimicrobium sp.]|nr:right-handed parallel beta-helix repeat-containing protein [Longimicrobium sp.]